MRVTVVVVVASSRHWVELNHLLQGIQTAVVVVVAVVIAITVVKFDALVGSSTVVVGAVVCEIVFARSRRWW